MQKSVYFSIVMRQFHFEVHFNQPSVCPKTYFFFCSCGVDWIVFDITVLVITILRSSGGDDPVDVRSQSRVDARVPPLGAALDPRVDAHYETVGEERTAGITLQNK